MNKEQFYALLKQGMQDGASAVRAEGDPLRDFLSMERLKLSKEEADRRQTEGDERQVERYSAAVQKANIPQAGAAVEAVEQATGLFSNPEAQLKSTGPVASALPAWAINLGEGIGNLSEKAIGQRLGMPERGAGSERQALQRLLNMDIKTFAGTAASKYEEGRKLAEAGLSLGADSSQVKQGMKMMADAVAENARAVNAGADPRTRETFRKRGGFDTLQDYLQPKTGVQVKTPLKTDPQVDEILKLMGGK